MHEVLPRLLTHLSQGRPSITPEQQAAVAMILRQGKTGGEMLVIQRAERAHDPWSGHMALPGGRSELTDNDLVDTALREVFEEVGWQLKEMAEYVGSLPAIPIRARGRFQGGSVVPLVFALQHEAPWHFNPDEVVDALWLPLAHVLSGEINAMHAYSREKGVTMSVPAYRVGHQAIWGLTYHMIGLLLEVVLEDIRK